MQFLLCISFVFFAVVNMAAGLAGPLDTPDLTPYDPVEVLCTLGREAGGAPKISPWCKNWLQCIKSKANPEGTPEAVMKAWSPANCKEYCGHWPVMTAKEGTAKSFLENANASAVTGLINMHSQGDCLKSCGNFQSSLSSCVATIMFEPGKVAAMGIPKKGEHPLRKFAQRKTLRACQTWPSIIRNAWGTRQKLSWTSRTKFLMRFRRNASFSS